MGDKMWERAVEAQFAHCDVQGRRLTCLVMESIVLFAGLVGGGWDDVDRMDTVRAEHELWTRMGFDSWFGEVLEWLRSLCGQLELRGRGQDPRLRSCSLRLTMRCASWIWTAIPASLRTQPQDDGNRWVLNRLWNW